MLPAWIRRMDAIAGAATMQFAPSDSSSRNKPAVLARVVPSIAGNPGNARRSLEPDVAVVHPRKLPQPAKPIETIIPAIHSKKLFVAMVSDTGFAEKVTSIVRL